MKKAINNFLRPPDLPRREQRYHFHAQVGIFPDSIFMILSVLFLLAMDVPTMPVLGVVFILVLIPLEHYLIHRRNYILAHIIQVMFVAGWIITGIIILGWDCGLQYYCISAAIGTQFYMIGNTNHKRAITIFYTVLILSAAFYTDYNDALFSMTQPYLSYYHHFNIFVTMAIFIEMTSIIHTLQKFEKESIKIMKDYCTISYQKKLQKN